MGCTIRRRRLRSATSAALLFALLACSGGSAAQPTVERDGFTLSARERPGERLCLRLTAPDDAYGSSSCDRVPTGPYAAAVVQRASADALFGIAVDRDVAAVESGGERVPTTVLPGGSARIALVRTAGPDTVVRTYDAGGALVGAVQPDSDPDPPPGRTVFRADAYTVRARRGAQLYPTPLIPDRTRPTTCLATTEDGGGGSAGCVADDDLGAFRVEVHDRCAPRRAIVAGLVSAEVASVRVVLGSDRRLDVPARPLPAGLGPGHFVGAPIPRGAAVRSLAYRSTSERVLARERIGQAPTGRPCIDDQGLGTGFGVYGFDPGFEPVVPLAPVEPGSPLSAADGPELTLCTAVGGGKPLCRIPPVDADGSYLARRGNAVGGPVAPGTKAVALRLDDGSRRRVAATAGLGYTGPYAGLTRFVAFRLPEREVRHAVAIADNGRRMGAISVAGRSSTRTRRTPLPGGLVAVRLRTIYAGRADRTVCVAPRGPGRSVTSASLCSGAPTPHVVVAVTCSPRRTMVLGRGDRPSVRLRDGRILHPRVRHLRGLGPFWSVRLPADAAVAATGTEALRLPAAARQCGYEYAVPT